MNSIHSRRKATRKVKTSPTPANIANLCIVQAKATLLQKYSNIVFMNSVMSSRITIAYLLMAVKKVTDLLLLWSIETIQSVFDYLIQQASSELNYMPFCLR